jgi:hypothetical protein
MIGNIQNTKIDIIQWITTLNDERILEKIVHIREKENKDWWDTISEAEKKSIEKGIFDADNDNVIPHEEVKKLYEKWL